MNIKYIKWQVQKIKWDPSEHTFFKQTIMEILKDGYPNKLNLKIELKQGIACKC